MRKLITLLAVCVVCSTAHAATEDDALLVLEQWLQAFNASDVDGIVSLYAPDALFFGTTSRALASERNDIRAYFERALLRNRPRSATFDDHSVRVLSESIVVVTGLDVLGGVRDGAPYTTTGRVTFVLEQRSERWQIVHFHRSAQPD